MFTSPIGNSYKELRNIIILALLVAAPVSFLFLRQTTPYLVLDHVFYDSFMKSTGNGETSNKVVVADVDDTSMAAVGQWPWPRYRIAALFQAIFSNSPALIGVDIIFPEPDRTSLATIKSSFSKDFDLDLGFTGLPEGLTDNDGYLASVIGGSPVVGAKYFYFDHLSQDQECTLHPIKITDNENLLSLLDAPGILCNTEKIDSSLDKSGFINTLLDEDGVLRKIPLLIQYRDQIYPNLSLATLAKYIGAESIEVTRDFWGIVLRLGEYSIPVDRQGFFQLRIDGPGKSHLFISAVDLLNKSVKRGELKNKIVLVGASATALNDQRHTVFDSVFPGIETHAVFLSNVFNSRFIRIPSWQRFYVVVICFLTTLITGTLFVFFSPVRSVLLSCSWLLALVTACFLLFKSQGIYFPLAGPVMVTPVMIIVGLFVRYFEVNQKAMTWIKELVKVQQTTLDAMAAVAETRDPETGGHIQRTKRYVKVLAEYLRQQQVDDATLTKEYVETIFHSAPLHDIGKVGIPDHILLKPSSLDEDEFAIMKRHTEYGANIIESVSAQLDENNFLKLASEIAATHHEKWDGSGYPKGMEGEQIPLSGRLMALADVYDALVSRRQYKEPYSHEIAKRVILKGKGSAFDPMIIDAFLQIEDQFVEIAKEYKN